jgi:hypothetical protein
VLRRLRSGRPTSGLKTLPNSKTLNMVLRLPATSRRLSKPVDNRAEPSHRNNEMRLTVVDTLSTIFFFTTLAAVTELYVAGMEHAKVLKIRAVMIPMMILTGRPYGAWRSERPWSEARGP